MKKTYFVITVILIIVFVLGTAGCGQQILGQELSANNAAEIEKSNTPSAASIDKQIMYYTDGAKYAPDFIKNNLDELEEISSTIVKATILDSIPNPDLGDKVAIRLTTIRIDDVLKADGTRQKGDNKIIVEYYRTEQDPENKNVINVFSTNGSLPLKINQQYLLFLQKPSQDYGDYCVSGAWQGKYPIAENTVNKNFSDLTEEALEFPEDAPSKSSLMKIAEQVFEKYIK